MKLRDSLAENKSIRLQAEAETWQEAVKIGVDLLVAADVVEPRYYQAIWLKFWQLLMLALRKSMHWKLLPSRLKLATKVNCSVPSVLATSLTL